MEIHSRDKAGFWVLGSVAYTSYKEYCKKTSTKPQSKKNFFQSVNRLCGDCNLTNGSSTSVKPSSQVMSIDMTSKPPKVEHKTGRFIRLPDEFIPESWL